MILTPKQQAIFDFIKQGIEANGKAPTYRVMAERFGMNTNGIVTHLKFILKKGFLVKEDGRLFLTRLGKGAA